MSFLRLLVRQNTCFDTTCFDYYIFLKINWINSFNYHFLNIGLPGLHGKHGREGLVGLSGEKGDKGLTGLSGAPGEFERFLNWCFFL